jgi:hypothetical protein
MIQIDSGSVGGWGRAGVLNRGERDGMILSYIISNSMTVSISTRLSTAFHKYDNVIMFSPRRRRGRGGRLFFLGIGERPILRKASFK